MSKPTPPSVPAEASEGPEEGTLKMETRSEVAAEDSDPKRRLRPDEMEVYVASRLLVTRKVTDVPVHIKGERFMKGLAAGRMIQIKPGRSFVSLEDVVALGAHPNAVDDWVRTRGLVKRKLATMHMQTAERTPAVLGNSTGSQSGDDRLGTIHRNRPGVMWGFNPAGLAGKPLGYLQAQITSTDPSITPPDSESECIRILSQDFSS